MMPRHPDEIEYDCVDRRVINVKKPVALTSNSGAHFAHMCTTGA